MDIKIKSYEDFANKYKKYDGSVECFAEKTCIAIDIENSFGC